MKVIDLFCGVGGFSKGFEMAGHEIILGVDNWGVACSNFKLNHPKAQVWNRDIALVDELPPADIIIAGPPCQEFTSMNLKRQPWRGMLNICHFLRIVAMATPKYWLMENVLGLLKYLPSNLPYFKLKASDFGCLSGRWRLFVGNIPCPLQSYKNPKPLRTTVSIDNRNIGRQETEILDVDELTFKGTESQIRYMAANAVPPKLAYAISLTVQ